MKPIFVIILAVVVGAAGFFAGMKYSQSQRQSFRGNFAGQFQNGGQARQAGQGRFNGRPVAGEIVSADDKSVTVKMTDGQSKIVLFSDTTRINQATQTSTTDLKQGVQIAVFGSENSDGSVTAQNIEINPQMGRFRDITPGVDR